MVCTCGEREARKKATKGNDVDGTDGTGPQMPERPAAPVPAPAPAAALAPAPAPAPAPVPAAAVVAPVAATVSMSMQWFTSYDQGAKGFLDKGDVGRMMVAMGFEDDAAYIEKVTTPL